MKIMIIETGRIEILSIVDKNGIEWTRDCVTAADFWNSKTEQHEMSQNDFDWWKEYIENHDNDEEEILTLAEELNIDEQEINDKIMIALQHENDLGDEHQIKQNVFEELREEYKN